MSYTGTKFLLSQDLINALPLIILSGMGMMVLLLEAFSRVKWVGKRHNIAPTETSDAFVVAVPGSRFYLMLLTSVCLATVMGILVWQWFGFDGIRIKSSAVSLFQNTLQIDRFGLAAFFMCVLAALGSIWMAPVFLQTRRMEFGEFYALVLFALSGVYIFIFSCDFVTLFIGLEVFSLALYVLTALWRRSIKSSEAGIKYFIMGGVLSALFLYGVALLYGTTRSTQFSEISQFLEHATAPSSLWIPLVGSFLVIGGMLFKLAAAPLHMWAPDVYEGSPTPVTSLMMTIVKIAAVVVLIRLTSFLQVNPWIYEKITPALCTASILSMLLGNIVALRQDNIKRMLAYSSIGHAGYLLIGILLVGKNTQAAGSALLIYLAAYLLAVMTALGSILWVEVRSERAESYSLSELAGLGKRSPVIAFFLTLSMLSLAGFPPTLGFFGKFSLFKLAFQDSALRPLVVLALITSLVGVAYYFRVIMTLYFKQRPDSSTADLNPSWNLSFWPLLLLCCTTAATLFIGIFPNRLVNWLSSAILGNAG